MTDWSSWVGATGMGLFASLATGQVVGFVFSRKLPTFQMLFGSFVMAVVTWGVASLAIGAMFWLGMFFLNGEWAGTLLGHLGLGGLAGLSVFFLGLLLWRLRVNDGRRWATTGAMIPWSIVAITSAGAYYWFTTTDTWNYQVPEFFWGCVFMSMAIGIILGSCAGGMLHHQTRHLRNH